MAQTPWHIEIDGDRLTLSRRARARFDFAVETILPDGNRARVAHQIRQDMWRGLQSMRGFSPVVEVTRMSDGLCIKAGGQVDGRFPLRKATDVVSALLEDEAFQTRWSRCSARQKVMA